MLNNSIFVLNYCVTLYLIWKLYARTFDMCYYSLLIYLRAPYRVPPKHWCDGVTHRQYRMRLICETTRFSC